MSNTELITPDQFLPPDRQEIFTDLDYTRKNLYDLIESGTAGLHELAEIAKQSQNPRAFEVLATYLKTIAEINKDLIEVGLKKIDLQKPEETAEVGHVTNQLFLGSTADLLALIKKKAEDGTVEE